MFTHELKCWPPYFEAVLTGQKTFEVRLNDREYKVGEHLLLREWQPAWTAPPGTGSVHSPNGRYSGRQLRATITYVLSSEDKVGSFGLVNGYVVMGLKRTLRDIIFGIVNNGRQPT